MQVEEDKARTANPRGWPVSNEELRSSKEDIELRIFQISEDNKGESSRTDGRGITTTSRAGALMETKQICCIYISMTTALLWMAMTFTWMSQPYSVSVTPYPWTNMGNQAWQPQMITRRRSKFCPPKFRKSYAGGRFVFGALMAHGSCEKLVTMDLELLDEHKITTVRSKPFPASKADSEEIMRHINHCIAADLAEKYEQAEYPKHCSPCFLVDKPGRNAKRLVFHYGKLNKLTKKHSGNLPSLEQALERAAHCRYKSNLDKRSGFWQVELAKRAQDLSAFIACT